jgi:hypothetical protein
VHDGLLTNLLQASLDLQSIAGSHRCSRGPLVRWSRHMPAAQWLMAVQWAARHHTQRLRSWQLGLPAAHRCPAPQRISSL